MSTLENAVQRFQNWSEEKNIHEGAWLPQFTKFMEETSELLDELVQMEMTPCSYPDDDVMEAIGDVQCALLALAQRIDVDIADCINRTCDKVEDWDGEIVGGLFVRFDE